MLWRHIVWYGMIWCGVLCSEVSRYGMMQGHVGWCTMIQSSTVWCAAIVYGIGWHGRINTEVVCICLVLSVPENACVCVHCMCGVFQQCVKRHWYVEENISRFFILCIVEYMCGCGWRGQQSHCLDSLVEKRYILRLYR